MGVTNFWKIASKYGKSNCSLRNKKLAVDTSIWIHQILNIFVVEQNSTLNIYTFFLNRIIKLFYNDIDPIFVFDTTIPLLKQSTLLKRKEVFEELRRKKILEGIKLNKNCLICNKKLRICEHGGELREEVYKKLNLKSKHRVENHGYNWGEHSSESTTDEDKFTLDYNELNTQSKKMEKLIKLREMRKEKMFIDTKSPKLFMESQIANVQKRAQVSKLAREMSKHRMKVQGDSTIYSEIQKEEKKNLFSIDDKTTVNEKCLGYDEKVSKFSKLNEKYKHLLSKRSSIDTNKSPINNNELLIDDIILPQLPSDAIKDYLLSKYGDYNSEIQNGCIEKDEGYENYLINMNSANTEFQNIQSKLKQLLVILNINFIDSTIESDSQCAKLYKDKVVDGVISEDSDIIFYGAKVYKNFFSKTKEIVEFATEEILKGLSMSKQQLIILSFFLGSDYCLGIPNIGPSKALKIIRELSVDEIMEKYFNSDKRMYDEIFRNYNDIIGKSISSYTSGKVNEDDLLNFLEKEEVTSVTEIMYHLKKLDKLKK